MQAVRDHFNSEQVTPPEEDMVPGPNEIHHRWQSEDELLNALSTEPLHFGQQATIQAMTSRTDFDGAETVVYEWSLRDGRGDPLRYPIQLVARTSFDAIEESEGGG
ncbi:MAG: hypothetical protein OXS47_12230 [Chloroflexota bacterium]|nr:hypothetical protein [Chloroflexota bacterium]